MSYETRNLIGAVLIWAVALLMAAIEIVIPWKIAEIGCEPA